MKKIFTGILVFVFLTGYTTVANASTLTTSQVQAIVSVLKSFGVESSTLRNVELALGVEPSSVVVVPASPPPSPVVPLYTQPDLTLNAIGNGTVLSGFRNVYAPSLLVHQGVGRCGREGGSRKPT